MEAIEQCSSKNSDQDVQNRSQIGLTDLPFEVLQKIIGTLSFADISKIRLVSKEIHHACSDLLNAGYIRLQRTVLNRLEDLKSKMPRRSSVRRKHPLFKESELVEAVHLRLSVVNLKMSKHLERKEICFYPGGILDEAILILSGQKNNHPRPTEELFDLCNMAVEHFTEEIKPLLPSVSNLEFWDTSMNLLATDAKVDESVFVKEEDLFDDEYLCEEAYVFKETDEASMQAFQEEITEPALNELKRSLKNVTREIKRNSRAIKFMKFSLRFLNKNVIKLRKMVYNIKQQQNKCDAVDQEKSLNECLIKLNECNEIIESFESQLSNCGESEEVLMPSTRIAATEIETGKKNDEMEHCPQIKIEEIWSKSESSISSPSMASTSQHIVPKPEGSLKRKRKVSSKNVLKEKKIKFSISD